MPESRSTRLPRRTSPAIPPAPHPVSTPSGVSPNTGPLAAAAWLVARGLIPSDAKWFVEVTLAAGDTKLRLELFAEEWGFWFGHADKVSWIRVTDLPFVHGRDDHDLLAATPALKNIHTLVAAIEERFDVTFDREAATIRTSLVDAESVIRDWIASL